MRRNENCIAIYSRKSKFTGKGESIGNQIELCKEYACSHFGNDVLEKIVVYEDEGFSGGNMNRPDFKKMMEAARKRKMKAVIVYRLDRISRNVSDFSNLIEELERLDIAFVSIKEQFDTTTPMGRAMMYIASVFSQLERETIAERIRDNMNELAKTGRWLGGTTPTGYASESVEHITIDGKTRKACRLKLVPAEAEIVRLIYNLYEETDSLSVTETELMKNGVKTKNGKYFTRFSIKSILQNPAYAIADSDTYDYFTEKGADLFSERSAFDGVCGMMAYNRTSQEKGKSTEYLPISEWIVSVGRHPGIISGRMWVRIQESLERNKNKAYHKARSNEALLTGLLYCSCGSRMYPKLGRKRMEDGKPVYTYVCKLKERSRHSLCSGKNVNGNALDEAVIEQIKLLEEDRGDFLKQLGQNSGFYTDGHTDYEERLASLKKERAEAQKKMDALVDSLIGLGDSSAKNHIIRRMEQLGQETEEMDSRIQELQGLAEEQFLSSFEFKAMRQLLSDFQSSVDHMSVEQKRAAIRSLVRKVVWGGENAHIILFGASGGEIDYSGLPEPGLTETSSFTEQADTGSEDQGTAGLLDVLKTHRGEDSK